MSQNFNTSKWKEFRLKLIKEDVKFKDNNYNVVDTENLYNFLYANNLHNKNFKIEIIDYTGKYSTLTINNLKIEDNKLIIDMQTYE